jgi:2-polyprenyl-6-hydroxyphenyl methylase / 3-demethylubiquinone-9 3-methyltransferase
MLRSNQLSYITQAPNYTMLDMSTSTSPNNADPAELAKFSALAHRWWDATGEFKPLHALNPLRLEWIDGQVNLSGKKVLDVGCGGGILAESMAKRGASVTGIDLATKALKVAQLHAIEANVANLSYREVSAEALSAEQPESFDVVTCMEMLEHVPQPASVVQACAKLAKPGGHVFFSTINRNPKAWLFAVVGAEYVLNLLPKGTHEYAKFITPAELSRYIREAGLDQMQLKGMQFNPLTGRYWLNQDASVNYWVATRKPSA